MALSLSAFNSQSLQRWSSRRFELKVKLDLFIADVLHAKTLLVAQRVKIAGDFLRNRIVANLSRPVRKITSQRSGRVRVDPQSRSQPGEYPRADSTRLMKSIFHEHDPETATSRVGTPLGYGVILEYRLDRSFLRRTLNEVRQELLLIIRDGDMGASGGSIEI